MAVRRNRVTRRGNCLKPNICLYKKAILIEFISKIDKIFFSLARGIWFRKEDETQKILLNFNA